jgi:V/A-type H+-transporting ATPase subunit I
MRDDVKKFLFIGAETQRAAFFEQAQKVGIIHFIDMRELVGKEVPKDTPEDIKRITKAIKILRGLPPLPQENEHDFGSLIPISEHIVALRDELDKLAEEQRVLTLEIARVHVFGDFSIDEFNAIQKDAKRKIQFFAAKRDAWEQMDLPEEVIYVGGDIALDYFVAINTEAKSYEKMVEMHISEPLGALQKRLDDVEKKIHKNGQQLKNYAKYSKLLHHGLVLKYNQYNLNHNKQYVQFAEKDNLFAIEGWVPVRKLPQLQKFVDSMDVHCEEIEIEPKDAIPTVLDNEGMGRMGEDLVHIYDTPSHTDKDPSIWVLWSFSLFFAFIVGDGGYGLLYLALAGFLWYKYPHVKGVGRRMLKLFTMLATACVIWGILTTSFFGMKFDINSPLRNFSLVTWLAEKKAEYHIQHKDAVYEEWVKKYPTLSSVQDRHEFIVKAVDEKEGSKSYPILDKFSDGIMLELALMIGVIHLILSLARYLPRNLANIGWIIFLIGAYLYIPYHLDVTSIIYYVFGVDKVKGGEIGLQMVYWGIGIALVFSLIKNKILGLLEPANLIQVFADVLSYLRLYALGLAGSIVGVTINEMTAGLPAALGFILLLAAHLMNMVLGVMSGVIHGLRLNFLEWYHYSFEGGGKQYQPLNLKEVE